MNPCFLVGLQAPVLTSRRHSVLDIGVGAGRAIEPLSTMFEEYVGIDFLQKAITKRPSGYPSADLRVMDAHNLEFAEKCDCIMFTFNGIYCVRLARRELPTLTLPRESRDCESVGLTNSRPSIILRTRAVTTRTIAGCTSVLEMDHQTLFAVDGVALAGI